MSKRPWWIWGACLLCLLPLIGQAMIGTRQAFADGGAPNLAYVAGTTGGISTIDIGQQKVTGGIRVGGNPHMVLLSLDGRILYVTQPATGRLTAIATATKQTLCSLVVPGAPSLLAFDPGAQVLYVAGNQAAQVTALDPITCAIKSVLKTEGNVYGLAVAVEDTAAEHGTGNQLWVATTHAVTVFTRRGKSLARLAMEQGPRFLSIPPGETAYVTTQDGHLVAIDRKTWQMVPDLFVGRSFGAMDFNEVTGELYVPERDAHVLDVIAPVSVGSGSIPHEPAQVIHLPAEPAAVAITSDGQYGYIALHNGNVLALDTLSRQIVATLHVGGTPQFIITGLYPSLLNLTPQQAAFVSWLSEASHYGGIGIILLALALLLWRERIRRAKKRGS